MQRVTFSAWELEIDRAATAAAYAKIAHGAAAECGCADCRNWINERDNVLPLTFVQFLRELGIDPGKETEVSEYEGGAVDPNLNMYTGEYLFVGRVLAGPDCFEETSDKKGAHSKLEPIAPDFSLGVSPNLRWAMGRTHVATLFPRDTSAMLFFKTHAKRGAVYA